MSERISPDAPLRDAFAAAQTEADRLSGPPSAWNAAVPPVVTLPAGRPAAGRGVLWATLAVGLAVAAIAAVANLSDGSVDDARHATPPAFASRSAATASPAAPEGRTGDATATAASRNGVTLLGQRVEFDLLDAEAVPALTRLAQLTGAVISGLDLLPPGMRLTLRGTFPVGRESWAAVLAGANFVLSCAGSCTVFIVSGPSAAASSDGMQASLPAQGSRAQAPPPAAEPATAAPSGPSLVMSAPRTLDGRPASEDAEN